MFTAEVLNNNKHTVCKYHSYRNFEGMIGYKKVQR